MQAHPLTIRFEEKHLRLFAAASLDFHPIHLSAKYAHTTPFGQPVVYGMLGFSACLGRLTPLPGKAVSSMRVEFDSPLFLEVDYSLVVHRQGERGIAAALMDGSVTCMTLRLRFRDENPELCELGDEGSAPRRASRQMQLTELQPGLSLSGDYGPPRQAYLGLLAALGVDRQAWGDGLLLGAMCSSYLVGMELPGESALFTAMTASFEGSPGIPTKFQMAVESYDERYQLVESRFALSGGSTVYARGELSAVARSPRNRSAYAPHLQGNGQFAGKTALVIGASRGLGAALALELAAEGCTVVGTYAQSSEDMQQLLELSSELPGSLVPERGDASDLQWCVDLKRRICERFGGLDMLVCNAAPAVRPMRLEEATYDRMQAFLQRGFALVGAPLSSFLSVVSAAQGRVLLISSAFVEEPPRNWPHYVALKFGAEGLVRTAAAAHPKVTFWIARPGRLRTDMSNTPLGWFEAEDPAAVAHQIVQEIATASPPGEVHFCSFGKRTSSAQGTS
jgi:NAD(P)-dependent dehydrogenase (short-subunit alcohol dehydrogenase family)